MDTTNGKRKTYFVTKFGFGEQWSEDAARLFQYAFFDHDRVSGVYFEFATSDGKFWGLQ